MPHTIMVSALGMKLEKYLSTRKIKQPAFADLLGVSQVTISRYIRDERFPDPEMIGRIATATGNDVTVADWYAQAAEARAKKAGEAV